MHQDGMPIYQSSLLPLRLRTPQHPSLPSFRPSHWALPRQPVDLQAAARTAPWDIPLCQAGGWLLIWFRWGSLCHPLALDPSLWNNRGLSWPQAATGLALSQIYVLRFAMGLHGRTQAYYLFGRS